MSVAAFVRYVGVLLGCVALLIVGRVSWDLLKLTQMGRVGYVGHVSCPFQMFVDGRLKNKESTALWAIYRYDKHGTAPRIHVEMLSSESSKDSRAPSCALTVTRLPRDPLTGIDWRIGREINNPAAYRGKTARVRVRLKADREMEFGAASIYMYDGISVAGVNVPSLSRAWQEFVVHHRISDKATALEVWVRLTLHGTISTRGTIYLSNVRLDLS